MIRNIYIRHGVTLYSQQNKFAGRRDIPVVEFDMQMFNDSLKLIESHKPNILIHSPLLRAKQTSQLYTERFIFDEVVSEPLLLERDFGVFEGQLKTPENRKAMEDHPSVEGDITFTERVVSFLDKYGALDINVLVVGHSAFFRKLSELANTDKRKLSCCESSCFDFKRT